MFYARIKDGVAVEVVDLGKFHPDDIYHPDLAQDFVVAHDAVKPGDVYDGRAFSSPPTIEPTQGELRQIKQALIEEINAAAEAERKRYITAGEGQAMTYTEKLAQARAFLAATEPNAADYPMIANEVGITASTASGVASAVIDAYTAWVAIGAAIEKIRMQTNMAITEAADADAARAVRNTVVWPSAS
ncbi:hypothetical protein [Rhizobium sp. C1]|uniref:hypothetical protein n=1 Tax=Rhizobium sp. C1 TaxID=1349799 RepID=UPI001E2DFDFC|nr:hypothetical protein [Rhizobium sp. C1]MCD2176432.1 hypothetical protein [Rhizobium sp. C1]